VIETYRRQAGAAPGKAQVRLRVASAEGAGAAAFAALIKERTRQAGRRVGVIVTRQNIDRPWMQIVLSGGTPRVD
jgi:threonine dehydratase